MPTFAIYTNVSKDKVPENFLTDATTFLSSQLGKPESFITVRVHPDQMMSHGGTTAPCASVEIYSIGCLGEKNKEHAVEVGKFISEKLGVDNKRFYITFVDLERNNVACGLTTFAPKS